MSLSIILAGNLSISTDTVQTIHPALWLFVHYLIVGAVVNWIWCEAMAQDFYERRLRDNKKMSLTEARIISAGICTCWWSILFFYNLFDLAWASYWSRRVRWGWPYSTWIKIRYAFARTPAQHEQAARRYMKLLVVLKQCSQDYMEEAEATPQASILQEWLLYQLGWHICHADSAWGTLYWEELALIVEDKARAIHTMNQVEFRRFRQLYEPWLIQNHDAIVAAKTQAKEEEREENFRKEICGFLEQNEGRTIRWCAEQNTSPFFELPAAETIVLLYAVQKVTSALEPKHIQRRNLLTRILAELLDSGGSLTNEECRILSESIAIAGKFFTDNELDKKDKEQAALLDSTRKLGEGLAEVVKEGRGVQVIPHTAAVVPPKRAFKSIVIVYELKN